MGLTILLILVSVSLMLRIRLQRVGRKHEPSFRIVLTESQNSTKSGRIKEVLGSYDPRFNNPQVVADRVKYWISVGAKPTDTMHNILVGLKVVAGKKINVLPRKRPILKEDSKGEEKTTPPKESEVDNKVPKEIPEEKTKIVNEEEAIA